jgi:hypothetical protein
MNNNDYLIAALKKEADFHADLAKEKTTDDDANYHLRKVALFSQCAVALRNAQGEREAVLKEVLVLPKYTHDLNGVPCLDEKYGSVIKLEHIRALLSNKPTKPVGETPSDELVEIGALAIATESRGMTVEDVHPSQSSTWKRDARAAFNAMYAALQSRGEGEEK